MARDTDPFRNAMTAIEATASELKHVCLLQGSKYYGRHLGPFKTPAKESDARHFPPNFYYTQEDFLKELAHCKRWSYSLMRPHIVFGYARSGLDLLSRLRSIPRSARNWGCRCASLGRKPLTAR